MSKLCMDCLHRWVDPSRPLSNTAGWYCMALARTSPLDGSQQYPQCQTERDNVSGFCGPHGLLWKQKIIENVYTPPRRKESGNDHY